MVVPGDMVRELGCGAYEVEPEAGNDEPATVSEGVWRVFTDVSGSQCEKGCGGSARRQR